VRERASIVNLPGMETWFFAARLITSSNTSVTLMSLTLLTFIYRITKKNGIEINPEQAEVVREMFARVIRGDSLTSIIRWLNRNGHLGAFGGKWTAGQLRAALSNEKYMGHSLLQKQFRIDHIDKKLVPNHGELPQYYATETHPAIIDEATFEAAQQALEHIAAQKPISKPWEHHIFTGMIICSACGKPYRYVKNHGKSRWACPTYIMEGKAFCESKQIPEEIIMRIACDLLGWNSFDEEAFKQAVDHVTAIYPHTLIFHLRDGREEQLEWQNRSRAEIWTPEMKEKAREKARRKNDGKNSN